MSALHFIRKTKKKYQKEMSINILLTNYRVDVFVLEKAILICRRYFCVSITHQVSIPLMLTISLHFQCKHFPFKEKHFQTSKKQMPIDIF